MPRNVTIAGVKHSFPDDATDEEISSALMDDPKVRLGLAKEQTVAQATAGAERRGNAPPEGMTPSQELARARLAGAKNVPGAAVPATAALLAFGPAAIASPLGFAASTVRGGVGSLIGAGAGEYADRIAGTKGVFKTIGSVGGGLYGAGGGNILNLLRGSKEGILRGVLGRLTGAAEGEEASAAGSAVTKLAAQKAEADIAAKQALTATRTAQAQRIATLKAQAEERHALQQELLKRRLAGKAPLAPSTPTPAQPTPAAAPTAQVAPSAATPAASGALSPADEQRLVLAIQQQMGTVSGRQAVREYLKQQPKEIADRIRLLLARGVEKPATVQGPLFDPSQPGRSWVGNPAKAQKVNELSAELARMLGQ